MSDASSSSQRMFRTRAYRAGRLVSEDFPVEQVSDYLQDPATTVWVDLCAPDREDLAVVAPRMAAFVAERRIGAGTAHLEGDVRAAQRVAAVSARGHERAIGKRRTALDRPSE